MAEILTPDLCVIGAGSGGLSVAAAAASFGVSVVLVEKAKMGGDCLNYGCVPSKALLAAARLAVAYRRTDAFGVLSQRPRIDFAKVHDHVHGVIAAIAPNDSKERFTALGVRVIEAQAHFISRNRVAAGDHEIKARRFVIATGSSPAIPPIPGLDQVEYFTNETIFDLRICPRHLIVIGGGPIGMELAQAFCRLGADVTVLEAASPLGKDDPECAAIVLRHLQQDGVVIRSGINVKRIEAAVGVGIRVRVVLDGPQGEDIIEGSHLLVATGRRANVDGLNLEAAGIRVGPRGIAVNKGLRTTNRKVYAIGDVIGAQQFTHVANYHAGLVVRRALFRLPVRVNADVVPWVTFTDPELAQVGLMEAEARERYRAIRVLRWPYHENDRAQAEREIRGHIKIVTTKGGRILGATIVGAQAGELITTWTLAVTQKLNIRVLSSIIIPYPTLSEVGRRAALSYFTPSLTNPWVHRVIRFMRRWG